MSKYVEPMKVVCEIDQCEIIDLRNLLKIVSQGSPVEKTDSRGFTIGFYFKRDTDSDRQCALIQKLLSHIHIV